MDETQLLLIVAQFSTIALLLATLGALRMAWSVIATLRGRSGGELMRVILIVLAAFTITQAIIVFNTFGGVVGVMSYPNRLFVYSCSQWIVIVAVLWARRRLTKF